MRNLLNSELKIVNKRLKDENLNDYTRQKTEELKQEILQSLEAEKQKDLNHKK